MSDYHVTITGYGKTPTETVVTVLDVPTGRRRRRAWSSFLLLLFLAALSVFIPVGHFLLVPGFLFAAFASLFTRLGATSRVLQSRGTCPDCGFEQDFDLPGAWRLPQDITCRGCQRRLTLAAGPANQG